MPRDKPLPDAGYLFFGDSFARIFSLVSHPEVGVKAFKGGSAKGLTKETNENRVEIIKSLEARPSTQCAVFVFGNVDGEAQDCDRTRALSLGPPRTRGKSPPGVRAARGCSRV